mmetsp:Transcript_2842/g.6505  ORF Transcript_2842/g.6505 Transcript_2842/m.6505 type:complete len:80 (+) Transcript_2842:302-541(+)
MTQRTLMHTKFPPPHRPSVSQSVRQAGRRRKQRLALMYVSAHPLNAHGTYTNHIHTLPHPPTACLPANQPGENKKGKIS